MPGRGSFVITGRRVARCRREVVAQLLADAGRWSEWQPEIASVTDGRPVSAGDVVTGHARLLGFHVAGLARIEAAGEDRLVQDAVVGVRVRVSYELTEVEGGCRIDARLQAEEAGGAAGRVLTLLLRWRLRRMQRTALRRLAALCEGRAR